MADVPNIKVASLPHLVAGGVIAVFLLVFVNKFELFGATCYYIGSFSFNTFCIAPGAYYLAWIVVLGLAAYGLFKPAPKGPEQTPPPDAPTGS